MLVIRLGTPGQYQHNVRENHAVTSYQMQILLTINQWVTTVKTTTGSVVFDAYIC